MQFPHSMADQYYIIDFDSTIIKTEGLDELAKIVLKENPKKEDILAQIQQITNLGMEGKMGFTESLRKRLSFLQINKSHIEKLVKVLRKQLTSSVLRNKKFFKSNNGHIYIISGGFMEYIAPVVEKIGISQSKILANSFKFDKKGSVTGIDETNPLSKTGGKIKTVKNLNLAGEVIVIGDGYTDLEIKQSGIADYFYAFTENVSRENVTQKADKIIKSFDEFLFESKLPMVISYPKSKMKVLLLENIETSAKEILENEGYQVELLKQALSENELAEKIKDISILGIRSKTRVTEKVLKNANKLKVIGAFCIGTDQMDLKALTEKGVSVFNAPFQNTRSVVELTLGEIIMLIRGIPDKNRSLHKGIWDKTAKGSNEIRGKTIGIVGYGNIGSQLSILAENLGMSVVYFDSVEKLPLGNAKRAEDIYELLRIADIITIHVSGDKRNTNLIGEKEFAAMKNGAIFLNLSRGFIVNIDALVNHIKSGKIRGAAIDVFPFEPKSKDKMFTSNLQNLPNVILTPHIAGSTSEAQKNIAQFVSGKIIDFINTGNTYLSVNIPNIQLQEQKNSHRLLHMHKNTPGILAQINKILADNGININGQYLKTNESIGYVITDVNKKYNKETLKQLSQIPDTINFRVLY